MTIDWNKQLWRYFDASDACHQLSGSRYSSGLQVTTQTSSGFMSLR